MRRTGGGRRKLRERARVILQLDETLIRFDETLEHHTGMQMCEKARAVHEKNQQRQMMELGILSTPA